MRIKNNGAAAKPIAPAANASKAKKPSKAEQARKDLDRAIASANKKLESTTLESALASYAAGEIKVDGLRNVYAMALNHRFAFLLNDHKLHWTVLWESKTQRNEQSNMHPLWKAVEAARIDLETALTSGPRKHSNPAQVWKRVRERSYQLAFPGQKRAPRQTKLPADVAIHNLIAAYKAVARETVQSERDEQIAEVLGRAIIQLKLDLDKINQSIG